MNNPNIIACVYQLIVSDTELNAQLKGNVFPVIAAHNAQTPFVVINVITSQPTDVKARTVGNVSRVDVYDIQVDVYTNNALRSLELSNDIRNIIDGFRGQVTTGSYIQFIDGVQFVNQSTHIDDDHDRLFRIRTQYSIRLTN